MLLPSQFNITKAYLELVHAALEREFLEYLLESELLTVTSTIAGLSLCLQINMNANFPYS